MISGLRDFDDTVDLYDGLALGDQLIGGIELADDLLRRVHGVFHRKVPGPIWAAEDSHSPGATSGVSLNQDSLSRLLAKPVQAKAWIGFSKTVTNNTSDHGIPPALEGAQTDADLAAGAGQERTSGMDI